MKIFLPTTSDQTIKLTDLNHAKNISVNTFLKTIYDRGGRNIHTTPGFRSGFNLPPKDITGNIAENTRHACAFTFYTVVKGKNGKYQRKYILLANRDNQITNGAGANNSYNGEILFQGTADVISGSQSIVPDSEFKLQTKADANSALGSSKIKRVYQKGVAEEDNRTANKDRNNPDAGMKNEVANMSVYEMRISPEDFEKAQAATPEKVIVYTAQELVKALKNTPDKFTTKVHAIMPSLNSAKLPRK